MKIKVKDIDRLIEILNKKKEELINEGKEYSFELRENRTRNEWKVLPDKWAILITNENVKILQDILEHNIRYYKDYYPSWEVKVMGGNNHFHFPQANPNCHSNYEIHEEYELIDYEEYKIQLYNLSLPF